MAKQHWINGKRANNRTKFIAVKFLEDGKTVVLYVFEDYKGCLKQIEEDTEKKTKYFGKVITTITRMREYQHNWLEHMNRAYNQKCTDIKIL